MITTTRRVAAGSPASCCPRGPSPFPPLHLCRCGSRRWSVVVSPGRERRALRSHPLSLRQSVGQLLSSCSPSTLKQAGCDQVPMSASTIRYKYQTERLLFSERSNIDQVQLAILMVPTAEWEAMTSIHPVVVCSDAGQHHRRPLAEYGEVQVTSYAASGGCRP